MVCNKMPYKQYAVFKTSELILRLYFKDLQNFSLDLNAAKETQTKKRKNRLKLPLKHNVFKNTSLYLSGFLIV